MGVLWVDRAVGAGAGAGTEVETGPGVGVREDAVVVIEEAVGKRDVCMNADLRGDTVVGGGEAGALQQVSYKQ